MLTIAYWITQALLTVAVFCAVYRVFRGPSVLDRVISVDVILIIVSSMLITDMVARDHQDFILFVIATAVIGFLGAVAIARYVAVRRPDAPGDVGSGAGAPDGAPTGAPPAGAVSTSAGPSTRGAGSGAELSGGGLPGGGPAGSAASPSGSAVPRAVEPHGGSFAVEDPAEPAGEGAGSEDDPAGSWLRELKRQGFTPRRRRDEGRGQGEEE